MKLEYRILKIAKDSIESCNYCPLYVHYGEDITFTPATHEIMAYDNNGDCADIATICDNCKKDFENNNLSYCELCGRLQRNRRGCYCNLLKDGKFRTLSAEEGTSQTIKSHLAKETKELERKLKTAKEELNVEREEVAKFQEKSEE